MAIIIVGPDQPNKKLSKDDFEKAREEYVDYIKITIDLGKEIIALGGEYHADAEKKLLETGSKQEDVWGGGVNLKLQLFEIKAMINLRSKTNYSTEILNEENRKRFLEMAKEVLKNYVKT